MKSYLQFILEKTEFIYTDDGKVDGNVVGSNTKGAITFGWYKNKLYFLKNSTEDKHTYDSDDWFIHADIADNLNITPGRLKKRGRILPNEKIIGFINIDRKEIKSTIDDLEKELGIKIWNNGYQLAIGEDEKYYNDFKYTKTKAFNYFGDPVDTEQKLIPLEEFAYSDSKKTKPYWYKSLLYGESKTNEGWGEKEKKVEPTEKELFVKYYHNLYLSGKPYELTIIRAFEDKYIDKEDAIEIINEQGDNWIKKLGDYAALKFYELKLLTNEQLLLRLDDGIIHNGELKWYVDSLTDLPGMNDEYLNSVLNDEVHEWISWDVDYSVNDVWYNLNDKDRKNLVKYLYNKDFEYHGEDYVLTPDMVTWSKHMPKVKLGEEEVDIDDLIDASFEDIKECMSRGLLYASEGAKSDAYYKEAHRLIRREFGDYEEIKHGKTKEGYDKWVYVFDLLHVYEICEYWEDDDKLEMEEYSGYCGMLGALFEHNETKIEYSYHYKNEEEYGDVKSEDVWDNIKERFLEEGIEKEVK